MPVEIAEISFSQENRMITLTTPLGDDVLLLSSFSGTEAISRLFTFHLDVLTQKDPISYADIIGKNVTISVQLADGTTNRYFNGFVSRFAASGMQGVFIRYQMEVVPWTWMLTRYADCAIYHNKTVEDILNAVFQNRGFTDFRISLSGSYSPLEYCVQYRETDFNFISRLMEQYGIFYFFEHTDTKHTMVITDSASTHASCPGQSSASYYASSGGLETDDIVQSFDLEQILMTGKYTLTDYNFITPSASLLASEPTINTIGNNSNFEIFDYPGIFTKRDEATAAAKLRMQEHEAGHMLGHGSGTCRAFTTGYKFTLTDHYIPAVNDTYLLTEIQHMATVAATFGEGAIGSDQYSNRFTCIPLSVPFRPARITPKPFVQGPQTAIVVGKDKDQSSGDEDDGGSTEDFWVDKYGRVVVLFPWDRKTACSCRLRVAQSSAGEGFGSVLIPRVGQEVVVSFLEGDPDRPIITGSVYNANLMPPYALPDHQSRTTIMSRTTPGGGDDDCNEIRFEDKAGAEQVFIRAQFDMDTNVKNDARVAIAANSSLTVGGNLMENIGGEFHTNVGGVFNEAIGGDASMNYNGNLIQNVGQDMSLSIGSNLAETTGQNYAHEAGQEIHLKGGMKVIIEAGMQLSLKVGGNFIDIGPSGVSIVGTMVMINSGGAAGSGSGASTKSPTKPKDPDKADDGSKGTKM